MKNKNHKILRVMTTLLLTGMIALTGVSANAFLGSNGDMANGNEYKVDTKNLAVAVKEKSLSAIDMGKGQEIEIDKDGVFKNPRISPQGDNVAYTKDGVLYVSGISLADKKDIVKVNDAPLSYSWKDKDTIIYSLDKGGLYGFNLKDRSTVIYIDSQEEYRNMVYGKDGKIYYEKYYNYTKEGQQYISAKGMISYDVLNKKETVIIEPRDFSEEKNDFGLSPVISKISPDGRYIYIWMKTKSASINADGVAVGVYDIDKANLTTFNNKEILVLAYNDNIAINPIDNSKAALNNGGLRWMNINKTLVMANGAKGTWEEILPKHMISTSGAYGEAAKGITTMTPAFSPDGKKVIYSGAIEIGLGSQWDKIPHNIYSIDTEKKKIEQITTSNTFNFAPNYIDRGKAIVFLRKVSDKEFEMWKVENSKESCLVKGIKIDENSLYYGHYNLESVMDVYIEK